MINIKKIIKMSNHKVFRKSLFKSKSEKNDDFKRREKKMFKKRKICHLKKVNELIQKCDTNVYMIIFRKNRYYIYNFTKRKNWSFDDEIVINKFESKFVNQLLNIVNYYLFTNKIFYFCQFWLQFSNDQSIFARSLHNCRFKKRFEHKSRFNQIKFNENTINLSTQSFNSMCQSKNNVLHIQKSERNRTKFVRNFSTSTNFHNIQNFCYKFAKESLITMNIFIVVVQNSLKDVWWNEW